MKSRSVLQILAGDTIEFHTPNCKDIKKIDYLILNGKWFTYEDIRRQYLSMKQSVDRAYLALINIDRIRFYIKELKRGGVTDKLEHIRLTGRKFFAPLNHIDDITADGKVNIEINC